jgi:hypothetical protein
MFNLKTYFEQVPLEFVKQIVEEQIQMDGTEESMEGLDDEALKEDLTDAERQSILEPRTLPRVRSLN